MLVLGAIILVPLFAAYSGNAQDQRAARAGGPVLVLDGVTVGVLNSAKGGNAYADVLTEVLGADGVAHKHIGPPKYEDITLVAGLGVDKSFWDWIGASLNYKHVRKNGSVEPAEFDAVEMQTLEFYDALVTEMSIPDSDAESKNVQKMTIKVRPEYTRMKKGSGNAGVTLPPARPRRRWISSNFRLVIDGVDCSKVSKIDGFTIKINPPTDVIGQDRDPVKEPGKIEFPNLQVTLPERFAQDFRAWHEDFLIKGNNGQDKEKGGSIEFLSPDRKDVLMKITLKNLGIFKLAPEEASAKSCDCDLCQTVVDGANSVRRAPALTASLYCEGMDFHFIEPPEPE